MGWKREAAGLEACRCAVDCPSPAPVRSLFFAPADCEDRRLQSVDPKTVAACAAAQVRDCTTLCSCPRLPAALQAPPACQARSQLAKLHALV